MRKTKRGPLTEKQRRLIEGHWPMVATVICRLMDMGRIRREHKDLAFSAAGRIAISAAKSYDAATGRFSTYLWVPLMKYLPIRIYERQGNDTQQLVTTSEDRKEMLRAGMPQPDRFRKGTQHDTELVSAQGLLKHMPDRRPGPSWEVDGDDEVARIEKILNECEEALPRPGSLLRRRINGESTEEMAKEAGISHAAINYQITTAKRWMAWRLFGDADWRASGVKSGRGEDSDDCSEGRRKAVRTGRKRATRSRVERRERSTATK